jgi:hypothetical protein
LTPYSTKRLDVKNKNGNLERAIRKIKYYLPPIKEWMGYITPSEHVALVKNGAVPSRQFDLEFDRACMKSGRSNPEWRSFTTLGPNLSIEPTESNTVKF